MRSRIGWFFPLVAAAAAAVALWAGPEYSIAVPAAAVAVGVSGLTLLAAADRAGGTKAPAVALRPPEAPGIREWFAGGPLGREEIVLALDRIERATQAPNLPSRPMDEVRRISALSPARFRAYVAARLDALEGDR